MKVAHNEEDDAIPHRRNIQGSTPAVKDSIASVGEKNRTDSVHEHQPALEIRIFGFPELSSWSLAAKRTSHGAGKLAIGETALATHLNANLQRRNGTTARTSREETQTHAAREMHEGVESQFLTRVRIRSKSIAQFATENPPLRRVSEAVLNGHEPRTI